MMNLMKKLCCRSCQLCLRTADHEASPLYPALMDSLEPERLCRTVLRKQARGDMEASA